GAYLPLDPTYPIERLRYMLTDAAPRLLLTQEHLSGRLEDADVETIVLDRYWSDIAHYEGTDLPVESIGLTSRNLAYVIYTSGSTGTPKGALNEHRGMVNRIVAQKDIEAYCDADICSQKTAISFVDAVFETWGALCNGRRLVIIPAATVRDPEKMAALIAKEGITQLITVPSLARSMLESAQIMQDLSGLRCWTLSGEEVRADLLMKLQRQLPECEFITLYGASEISSDAAWYGRETSRVRGFLSATP